MNIKNVLKNGLAPLIILIVAFTGYGLLIKFKPKAKVRPTMERVAVVETQLLKLQSVPLKWTVSGIVEPSKRVLLSSVISGKVIDTSEQFIPGGTFKKNEQILAIDPTDYRAAVATKTGALATAQYNYKVEMGWQDVAAHEWDMIDDKSEATKLDKELTLRKPHLKNSEQQLKAAKAELAKAKADLLRTKVKAPFNGTLESRSVELGATVGSNGQLATLVGTDEYWVSVTIPVSKMPWFAAGKTSATVRLSGTDGMTWTGDLFKMEPTLEVNGRMAKGLVRIKNPLTQNDAMPLLINSYVFADLEGAAIDQVFELSADVVHDGNSVWLVNAEDRLEVREVEVFWRNKETIIIKNGLKEGETLVVSDIPSAISGMKLKVQK